MGLYPPDFLAELPDGFEERQRFDVAHRAADLDDHDVVVGRRAADGMLDIVGDVGNHLHRRAEIFTAPSLADEFWYTRPVVMLFLRDSEPIHEALVVPEIQVGFRAVAVTKTSRAGTGTSCRGRR